VNTEVTSRASAGEPRRLKAQSQASPKPSGRPLRVQVLTLLVAGSIGAIAATVGTLLVQKPTYASSVTFLVQSNVSANDTEMLVRTYMSLIPTEVTGEGLKSKSGVDRSAVEIANHLDISRPPGAATLTVTYTDRSKRVSENVAEHLVSELRERTADLNEPAPGQLATTYSVVAWGRGAVTTDTVQPPLLKNALAGLLAGLILGLVLSVVRDTLRPVAGRGADQSGDFDVVIPHKLVGNPDVLARVGNLLPRSKSSNERLTLVVVGPVGDKDRNRVAHGLAAAIHGVGDAGARVVSVGESSSEIADRNTSLVVVGPRTPSEEPWVETARHADAVVLLARAGHSPIADVAATLTLLQGATVIRVLLDGAALKIG
jgi:capsular polysaccharide biosynthesis protein